MFATTQKSCVTSRSEIEDELDDLFRLHEEGASELLLVRHAEPAPVLTSSGGYEDPLLSCRGLEQAESLAERLRGSWFEAVYSAPERRALQTATLIAKAADRPLVTLTDLHDIDFMPTEPEMASAVARSLADRFAAAPRWDSIPGFSPSRSFRRRAIQTIESVLTSHPGRRVVVVTHSSLINAYLSMLLDIPRDVFFSPDHASVSVVRELCGLYGVRSLNDTSHLGRSLLGAA